MRMRGNTRLCDTNGCHLPWGTCIHAESLRKMNDFLRVSALLLQSGPRAVCGSVVVEKPTCKCCGYIECKHAKLLQWTHAPGAMTQRYSRSDGLVRVWKHTNEKVWYAGLVDRLGTAQRLNMPGPVENWVGFASKEEAQAAADKAVPFDPARAKKHSAQG